MVIDSNNELHLFWGQRISGNPDIHGMWHSRLINQRWTEPDAVVKGPLIRDPEGNGGFDPYHAQAVVSQGNVVLVAWRTDPAAGPNGVWYSFEKLDAPELPISAFISTDSVPTPDISLTPDVTENPPVVESTKNAIFDSGNSFMQNDGSINPSFLLLISAVPIFFLLLVIIIKKYR
jgi:hypothetical protein